MEEIVNRIAQSGIVTIDLEELFPEINIVSIDLKDILFHGMILREKDLREFLANINTNEFEGRFLNVFCSEDVILPQWIYMLFSGRFSGVVGRLFWGTREEFENQLLLEKISALPAEAYEGKRVVVKGCSNRPVSPQVFIALVDRLKPVVQSLMYGEACSTVPIYKKPKN
jgi:hypothetical protein